MTPPTTQEAGLKPCPSCASDQIRLKSALGESWARCEGCGLSTEMFPTGVQAMAGWNTRAAPTPEPMQADLRGDMAEAVRRLGVWRKCGMPDQSDDTPRLDRLKRDLDLVLAAMQAKSEPVAWRTMESAPDCVDNPEYVLIAEEDGSVYEARITDDGWYARNNDSTDHWGRALEPVAWMPLPTYPLSAHPSPSAPTDQGYLANPTTSAFSPSAPNPDLAGLTWLADHRNLELSFSYGDEDDDGAWRVHQVNGGINDREWTMIAIGETPASAIEAARNYLASLK